MPYKLGGSEAQAYFLERPLLPVEEEGAFLLAVSRLPHPGPQHLPHLLQVLLAVVSRVMRKFDLALAEIYFRGRVHAPWLPSSGQGAKGQGRRYAARLALDAL